MSGVSSEVLAKKGQVSAPFTVDSDDKQGKNTHQPVGISQNDSDIVGADAVAFFQQKEQLTEVENNFLSSSTPSDSILNQQASTNQPAGDKTTKEHISSQNQTAVAHYKVVGNLAQRESVQQMFGVDLFA